MIPPFISYITFNRLGLTVRNLPAILDSTEDFEMHIIDCNSRDDTWDYISSLDDSRIKTKERMDLNHGKTYALNLHLLRRSPEQYFFSVDSGAFIETKGWIGKFLKVFEAFDEVGLLGVRAEEGGAIPAVLREKGPQSYLELSCTKQDSDNNYIPGSCMCLRPDLIREIGYFCEENCFGDRELCYRVRHYTKFKAGFLTDVRIRLPVSVTCEECPYSNQCKLGKVAGTCFSKYERYNKNDEFLKKNKWRFEETVRDMESGARPVYCASLLDASSTRNHIYNKEWAMDNLVYFIRNAN
jgi:hypothetical protein